MDALILAGGENKRLPIIKGLLEINGRRIIESNIELLCKIFNRVIISTNNPELYFYLGIPMIGDVIKYKGPMTGILSSLINLEVPEIFVTACDMPFMNSNLIKYIVNKWAENTEHRSQNILNFTNNTCHSSPKKSWDAIVPIFDNRPQPLLGIYSRGIAPRMEKCVKERLISLRKFLQEIDVFFITEEEVSAIDLRGKSFVNINTPEDFEREIGGGICLV